MKIIEDTFNNRELAIIFWGIVLFIWAILHAKIRASIKNVIRAFFKIQILIPVFLMFLYIAIIIYGFYSINIWDTTYLKDTIYWTLGVAFVLLLNIFESHRYEKYFRKILFQHFKLIIILEFVVNLYVFSLWLELILMPMVTIVILMKTIAETDEQYSLIIKPLEVIIGIYGIAVLIFSVISITKDFSGFTSWDNLKSFLLPFMLTFLYIPYVFFIAIYALYESIFTRLSAYNNDKDLVRYAKKRIFMHFHLNMRKLSSWSKSVGTLKVNSKADVYSLLRREQ